MTALEKKKKLKKSRTAFWINLPICIISLILGVESINSMILWQIVICAFVFLISINMAIIIFQHINRLQQADQSIADNMIKKGIFFGKSPFSIIILSNISNEYLRYLYMYCYYVFFQLFFTGFLYLPMISPAGSSKIDK